MATKKTGVVDEQLQEKFRLAVAYVTKGPPLPTSQEQKLHFYALFKQVTEGSVKGKKPGLMDMVGRYKWDAWNKLGKLDKASAMKQYIQLVDGMVKDWQSWSGLQAALAETLKTQSKL